MSKFGYMQKEILLKMELGWMHESENRLERYLYFIISYS